MKKSFYLLGVVLCLSTSLAQAQHCTAAFLDTDMVVDEYSTSGKCVVPATAKGQLSVCTVELSETSSKAIDKISFRIAIKDAQSQQVKPFSGKIFKQVDIQQVLAKCKKGDKIVLRATAKGYDLPHNEILVQ
jgi:hypothetical protein